MKKRNKNQNKLKVSTIVVFKNEAHSLGKTLESIFAQNYPREFFEVICVDDGSIDNSYKIAKRFNVVLIRTRGIGISASRNLAIKRCEGDIILFLDGHLYLKQNIFKIINRVYNNYPGMSGICGRYYSVGKNDKNYIRDIRREAVFRKSDKKFVITKEKFTTFSIAIGSYRRALFDDFLFPEGFEDSAGEDIFFQLQVMNKGYKLMYNPAIVGIHDAQISKRVLLKKMLYEIKGMGNILYYSGAKGQNLYYLHYFLSYPLIFLLSLILAIVKFEFFSPLFVITTVFEFKDSLRCFFVRKYAISQRIKACFYLIIKELIQAFYIPYFLIFNKKSSAKQLLFATRQFFNWEAIKIRQNLKLI